MKDITSRYLLSLPEGMDTDDEKAKEVKGLTVVTAAVFIVGEIAGSGVLALPSAVEGAGWIGIVMLFLCCFISTYTGDVLGTAWCIIQERYEQYRGHIRYPYPAIGEITYGKPGRYLVSFSINFTMYGGAVVYLILASENLQSLLSDVKEDISFCFWLLIVAGILLPLAWLGTPKDFWPIAVGAALATGTACIILTTNMVVDKKNVPEVVHDAPGFVSFFTAFGTICFAFGGHPAFPTFQTDMKDHKQFGKAVFLAYMIVLAMYIPVSVAGYYVYGRDTQANILQTVSPGPMLVTVQILVTLHLFCGFIIIINPFSQEVEEIFKIPHHFGWKRCLLRTAIVALVLFGAETVPKFGAILALVGGSTISILAFICPPLFYLKLAKMEGDWEKIDVPLHKRVALYEIVLVGLVAGVASTYSAFAGLLSPGAFTVPCYVNLTAASGS
ncbi:uncharacterized protein [Haliotis asinina]|uniref:uncharacterized protein isoform X1 n=1 Tax=Haliotis asinina TaxID=109174 RepID=UPI0035323A4C